MVILGILLLVLAAGYLAVGVGIGMRFATVTAAGFNERAAVGSFPFRMLLIPGAALLWPVILRCGAAGYPSQSPHGRLTAVPPDALTPEIPSPEAGIATSHRSTGDARVAGVSEERLPE